jgi:hypothetical protein
MHVQKINTDGYCSKTGRDNVSVYDDPDAIGHSMPFLQASS